MKSIFLILLSFCVLGVISPLPSIWRWSSSDILVDIKSDSAHQTQSIKDPTIVNYNGLYHIYATIHTANRGYNMVHLSFSDFSQANNAPWYYMDNTNGFSGYKCAPQLFYFTPHKLWYLLFQDPYPTYSTNTNPGNPAGWSTPKSMFTNMPSGAIDFFTICDNSTCYLFFSDDGGDWYRTQTAKSRFPEGWGGFTTVLHSPNKFTYFEASWVYKLTNQPGYVAGIEGIGSDGQRYYQAFTASSLGGSWTELTSTFASNKNVAYSNKWNDGISHGELIRAGYDEFLEVNPCGLKFLYQGVSPSWSGSYDAAPYKLGLLTATSGC